MSIVFGIHAVEEALAVGRPAERLLVAKGRRGGAIDKLVQAARAANVPVRFVSRAEVDRAAGQGTHQGVVLIAGAKRYATLEEAIEAAASPGLLVVLDGVQDPHNLGAVLRSAAAAGADGVIVPERRAAGITPATEKAAVGAVEHVAVARVTNVSRALDDLKAAGYWLVGFDSSAEGTYHEIDLTGPVALVLGGEEKGLREQVRKHCDFVVSIPVVGGVESLNVSVAAGIALYEARRQRDAKK